MGTGLLRRIHSRVSWMCLPVERSITVSAPQRIAQTIFSTSSAMDEVTAELPMLALILTRKLRPIAIGSSSGWLMLAGRMARPRATSSRTNSGVITFGIAGAEGLAGVLLGQARIRLAERLEPLVLADGDELHLGRDLAAPRVVELRDGLAGERPPGPVDVLEPEVLGRGVAGALAAELAREGRQLLRVAALFDPRAADARQAGPQVDRHVGVGVRAGRVVHRERRVRLVAERAGRRALRDERASGPGGPGASPRRRSCGSPGAGGGPRPRAPRCGRGWRRSPPSSRRRSWASPWRQSSW